MLFRRVHTTAAIVVSGRRLAERSETANDAIMPPTKTSIKNPGRIILTLSILANALKAV